ncbi:MAG: hypothetical protein WD396_07870 [Pseudohongiellaceae bacterium]
MSRVKPSPRERNISSRDGAVAFTGQLHFLCLPAAHFPAIVGAECWTIHDGKLYLNYNHKINEQWRADKEALIRQADANWPAVLE